MEAKQSAFQNVYRAQQIKLATNTEVTRTTAYL